MTMTTIGNPPAIIYDAYGRGIDPRTIENIRQTSEERYIRGDRIIHRRRTRAGVIIDENTSLTISAAWACLRYLSQTVAMLPWRVKLKTPKGHEVQEKHPVDYLLNERPNPEWSSFQFRETLLGWAVRKGNGYAEIERSIDGRPIGLWPLHPDRVQPMRDRQTGELYYDVSGNDQGTVRIETDDMFHLRGFGEGPVGVSMVAYAAESLGWAKAAQMFGAGFFGNGAQINGVVKYDKELSPQAMTELRNDWRRQYGGPSGQNGIAVLDNGMDFQAIGVEPEKGQFIQTNQHLVDEVCFVPGTKIITVSGVRNIEDVREGDLVLTHKGRWRPVKHVMSHNYNGELVTLKAKGLSQISATANHPFYIQPVKPTRAHKIQIDGSAAWKEAGSLSAIRRQTDGRRARGKFDCLTIPRLHSEGVSVDMKKWSPDGIVTDDHTIKISDNHRATSVVRFPEVGYELGYLCGLYVADGSTSDHQTIFYLGTHEVDIISQLCNYLTSIFNVEYSVKSTGTVTRIIISNQVIANFFSQFGKTASEKHFSDWCMNASKQFHEGLISGVVDGDGGRYKKDTYLRTTSESLTHQVRIILWSFGINTGSEYTKSGTWSIEGRIGVSRESWVIRWRDENERRGTMGVLKDLVFFTLNKLEKSHYEGVVYNLEVQEDESYTTTGGCVHNCRWFGVPPHKIYHLLRATFSNIEHQSIEVVADSIMPWASRFENEANYKLFGQNRRGLSTDIELNGLLRADTATRTMLHQAMRNMGAMNANEIRMKEGMNSIGPDGEKYIMQSGMTTLDKIGEDEPEPPAPIEPPVPAPDEPDEEDAEEAENARNRVFSILKIGEFENAA